MIANAMDGDDKLTAPQVSHKLKQLGLYIPQKKRSGANRQIRDQELNDSDTNDANASDDETLLSLMNRLVLFLMPNLFSTSKFYFTALAYFVTVGALGQHQHMSKLRYSCCFSYCNIRYNFPI